MPLNCCGNPWNSSVTEVCGTFDEPTVEDQGRCHTYRVKRSCEAPTLPTAQCDDALYETFYDPTDESAPFYVIASLFNESCLAITDENGDTITLKLI